MPRIWANTEKQNNVKRYTKLTNISTRIGDFFLYERHVSVQIETITINDTLDRYKVHVHCKLIANRQPFIY